MRVRPRRAMIIAGLLWPSLAGAQGRDLYRASMAAAEGALRAFDARAAREWLDLAPVRDRRWEWNYYDALLASAERVIRVSEGSVWAVDVSPDGGTVVAGTSNGDVHLFDRVTGSRSRTIAQGIGFVYDVAFSPDGATLATASADRQVRVLSLATGAVVRSLPTGSRRPLEIAFDSAGRRIAAALTAGAVQLWDAGSGDSLRFFVGHVAAPPVPGVSFLPDGRIVSGSWDNHVRIWDVTSGSSVQALGPGYGGPGALRRWSDVEADPRGRYIAAVGSDGNVHLWSTADWSERVFAGHTKDIPTLALSADGDLMATGSVDQTVRLWRVSDGQQLALWFGHQGPVQSVAFSRDGRAVVSSGDDGTVRVWDVSAIARRAIPQDINAYTIAWSPTGRVFAAGSHDGQIRLYDVQRRDVVRQIQADASPILGVFFTKDGSRLISFAQRGPVKIWDAAAGTLVRIAGDTTFVATAVTMSGDVDQIVATGTDKSLRVFEIPSGREVLRIRPDSVRTPTSVGLLAGGRVAITGWSDGTATSWRVATGDSIGRMRAAEGRIQAIAVEPTTGRAVLATDRGFLLVWDGRAPAPLHRWRGHDDVITALAVAPSGGRVVSVAGDQTLRVWDAGTWRSVATLRELAPYCVGFSPDNLVLGICTLDRRLVFLETRFAAETR